MLHALPTIHKTGRTIPVPQDDKKETVTVKKNDPRMAVNGEPSTEFRFD